MDFIRPWSAGVVLWVTLSVAGVYVTALFAPIEYVTDSGLAIVWLGSTGFVAHLLAAAGASLLHRAPQRFRAGRNAVAALGAPAAGTVLNIAMFRPDIPADVWVFVAWNIIALVGAVAGWLLVRVLRPKPTIAAPAQS